MTKPLILYYNNGYADASTVPEWVTGAPEVSPYGFYTTLAWVPGEAWKLSTHLNRLINSLPDGNELRLEASFLKLILEELGTFNCIADAGRARLSVILGRSGAIENVIVLLVPVRRDELKLLRKEGISLSVAPQFRLPRDQLFQDKRLGMSFPGRALSPEWVFLNSNDEVCEATYGNLFAVRYDGCLITPPVKSPCLPGITRGEVIEMAKKIGLQVRERPLQLADSGNWLEVFQTSSIGGLVPVNSIESWWSNRGFRGEITTKLQGMLSRQCSFYELE